MHVRTYVSLKHMYAVPTPKVGTRYHDWHQCTLYVQAAEVRRRESRIEQDSACCPVGALLGLSSRAKQVMQNIRSNLLS